jgi:hypothetical protein
MERLSVAPLNSRCGNGGLYARGNAENGKINIQIVTDYKPQYRKIKIRVTALL